MKNESTMKEEFKSKLLQAQSAEEVAGILKTAGMDESKAGQYPMPELRSIYVC